MPLNHNLLLIVQFLLYATFIADVVKGRENSIYIRIKNSSTRSWTQLSGQSSAVEGAFYQIKLYKERTNQNQSETDEELFLKSAFSKCSLGEDHKQGTPANQRKCSSQIARFDQSELNVPNKRFTLSLIAVVRQENGDLKERGQRLIKKLHFKRIIASIDLAKWKEEPKYDSTIRNWTFPKYCAEFHVELRNVGEKALKNYLKVIVSCMDGNEILGFNKTELKNNRFIKIHRLMLDRCSISGGEGKGTIKFGLHVHITNNIHFRNLQTYSSEFECERPVYENLPNYFAVTFDWSKNAVSKCDFMELTGKLMKHDKTVEDISEYLLAEENKQMTDQFENAIIPPSDCESPADLKNDSLLIAQAIKEPENEQAAEPFGNDNKNFITYKRRDKKECGEESSEKIKNIDNSLDIIYKRRGRKFASESVEKLNNGDKDNSNRVLTLLTYKRRSKTEISESRENSADDLKAKRLNSSEKDCFTLLTYKRRNKMKEENTRDDSFWDSENGRSCRKMRIVSDILDAALPSANIDDQQPNEASAHANNVDEKSGEELVEGLLKENNGEMRQSSGEECRNAQKQGENGQTSANGDGKGKGKAEIGNSREMMWGEDPIMSGIISDIGWIDEAFGSGKGTN